MTPRQILLKKFGDQTAIAEAAGCTRQAVSIAFKRGRLSFQLASILAKRMRIPVNALLTQWVPDTNRRAKQSAHVKRRLRAVEPRP
jgi:hypothetical protein